ncbi:hypothetical protein CONPUDRAFT_128725 [Coniophora puteana RWD-64-598 SS2]|uniref:non-specific serine/threonine protein kinase n=1 Tax=Coniophora puteana (strain RWD-64-598) TaxID=741705 RepID=A0A5M3MG70_CONPW|nr:uncharacterized protein CONPUDRAFT_128725 [Coniophora puteana RWD-64-598 SS2]EIW77754.1 hypothetical protein CONPUDRAFT_128725 [Coniophora puteana RWD-64-598 SS2]
MASSSTTPLTPTQVLLKSATIVSQGAEAKVYKAYLRHHGLGKTAISTRTGTGDVSDVQNNESSGSELDVAPVLIKYRFPKQYRHPSLDGSLTRARVAGEARALLRCLRSGVQVPGIRFVDATEGVLGIEWIDGKSVRMLLPGGAEAEDDEGVGPGDDEQVDEAEDEADEVDPLVEFGVSRDQLMSMIGTEIAKMHQADIIHGDLTTSNMMLRRETGDLALIDFGLAYHSTLTEDKAVDLYVLERAFGSTHPDSEPMFSSVLEAYQKYMGKDWNVVKKRLEDVRLRGRKRSMVG